MFVRAFCRRVLFRWTKKGRATRKLAEDFPVKEKDAFVLVASIEASLRTNSVQIARDWLEKEREATAMAAERAALVSRNSYKAPENNRTSGARLAR